jgi:hypothetical protein
MKFYKYGFQELMLSQPIRIPARRAAWRRRRLAGPRRPRASQGCGVYAQVAVPSRAMARIHAVARMQCTG